MTKVPQSKVKTTEICSPAVLETKSWKTRCQQGCLTQWLWGRILLASFRCSQHGAASSNPVPQPSHGLLLFSHVSVFSAFCLFQGLVTGIAAQPGGDNPGWSHLKILNLITLAVTYSHISPYSQAPGVQMCTYLFGGHQQTHHSPSPLIPFQWQS